MSQTSSESPDGPPPPRQRPPAARSPKDSSELDLWDFDEDTPAKPAPEAPEPPAAAEPEALPEIKPRPRTIDPSPRRSTLPERENAPAKRNPAPRTPSHPIELKRKPTDDIGELDGDWAEPEAAISEPEPAPVSLSKASPPPEPETAPLPEAVTDEEPVAPVEGSAGVETKSEPAPVSASPHALKTLLKFSKAETIGLGAFALVLVATAIVLLSLAGKRLPTSSGDGAKTHFPVKGSHVTLKEVTSFWREPITGKDSVRRDTKLIPVVKIETDGGPAALRVFFKDDKGVTVGDSSTRSTANGTIEIAATAGLEDLGMHAAYRTGETRPWKIEILEAPSTESSSQQFRPLLVIPVSTDRH